MRDLHRSLPLLALGLLGGCALAPRFETPQLSIVNVQVLSSDFLAQHVRVRLRVQNPNDRALAVGGQPFASGESAASFVVPALGEAEFDTNVTTNLAGTLMTLLSRGADSGTQKIEYRLSGKLSLSSGLLRSIPFDERGTFSLQ